MKKEELIKYWIETAEEDYKTVKSMVETKNNNWALFIAHLVIEKLLKAYYVKIHNTNPPKIHDLYRLCKLSNIDLNDEKEKNLILFTTFQIEARYQDL
ncbi:MAG: HEPN domain-containing protein [Elusimicrobiota bacterium]|jgi:HEPN domain-containing protein|nr:HEPN domain-containing protein [Elusimicrobiota bacterium]